MKSEITSETKFSPVTISITVESYDEFDELHERLKHAPNPCSSNLFWGTSVLMKNYRNKGQRV